MKVPSPQRRPPFDTKPTSTAPIAHSTPASPGGGAGGSEPTLSPDSCGGGPWRGGAWQDSCTPDEGKPNGGKQLPPHDPYVQDPDTESPGDNGNSGESNQPGDQGGDNGGDWSGRGGEPNSGGPGSSNNPGSNNPGSESPGGDKPNTGGSNGQQGGSSQNGGSQSGGGPSDGKPNGGSPNNSSPNNGSPNNANSDGSNPKGGSQPGSDQGRGSRNGKSGNDGSDPEGDHNGGLPSSSGQPGGGQTGGNQPGGSSSSEGQNGQGSHSGETGGNSSDKPSPQQPGSGGQNGGNEPASSDGGETRGRGSSSAGPSDGSSDDKPNGGDSDTGDSNKPEFPTNPTSHVTVQVPNAGNGAPAAQITTLGHTIGQVPTAPDTNIAVSSLKGLPIGGAFHGLPDKQPIGDANQEPPFVTEGHTIAAAPSGDGIIVDGTTHSREASIPTPKGSATIQVLPNGGVAIGTKTVPNAAIPVLTPQPQAQLQVAPPLVTLGHSIAAAPGGNGVVIDGTTVPVGSAISASKGAAPASVLSNGDVAIGTKTVPKAELPPVTSAPLSPSLLVTLGHSIAPAPTGNGIIIDNHTLAPGSTITANDGTLASILPGGDVVFGKQTIPWGAIPTATAQSQAITSLGHTIVAAPSGHGMVVDGTTIAPGSPVTATDGKIVSVLSNGNLLIGTNTIAAKSIPTPAPASQPLTTLGHTIVPTPSGGGLVVDGATLMPGTATIASGETPISVLPDGGIAIGTATIPASSIPRPAPGSQLRLSVLGHSISASPLGNSIIIDDTNLKFGTSTTLFDGTQITVSSKGDVEIGAQTIPRSAIPSTESTELATISGAVNSQGVLIDGKYLSTGATSTANDGTVFNVLNDGRVVIRKGTGKALATGTASGIGPYDGMETASDMSTADESQTTSWYDIYPSSTMTGGSGYYTTPAGAKASNGLDAGGGVGKKKDDDDDSAAMKIKMGMGWCVTMAVVMVLQFL